MIMRMKGMEFYHKDEKVKMNDAHYHPSFLAKDVGELRDDPNTRKELKNFRIFENHGQDEDDGSDDSSMLEKSEKEEKSKKSKERKLERNKSGKTDKSLDKSKTSDEKALLSKDLSEVSLTEKKNEIQLP